VGKNSEVGFA
jgi:hypothetical protein